MDAEFAYRILLATLFALAGVTFVAVGRTPAPYGRHFRRGFGPAIPVRLDRSERYALENFAAAAWRIRQIHR